MWPLLRFEATTEHILRMQCRRSASARCLVQGIRNFRIGWFVSKSILTRHVGSLGRGLVANCRTWQGKRIGHRWQLIDSMDRRVQKFHPFLRCTIASAVQRPREEQEGWPHMCRSPFFSKLTPPSILHEAWKSKTLPQTAFRPSN